MEQTEAVNALGALAHQSRLSAFRLLVRAGPDGLAAGAIGDTLDLPAPTLSFHLKELRQADLVQSDRVGRSLVYRADYPTMTDLLAFLTDQCCEGATEAAPRTREAIT